MTQISSIVFQKMFTSHYDSKSTWILVAGIISIFCPLYLLLINTAAELFKEKRAREQNLRVDYDDIRMRFSTEYDRTNPITKDEALIEYFQFIRGSLDLISQTRREKPDEHYDRAAEDSCSPSADDAQGFQQQLGSFHEQVRWI